ncbi:MAG: PAS domain S-box protein [Burkholderiaceae bacterium]
MNTPPTSMQQTFEALAVAPAKRAERYGLYTTWLALGLLVLILAGLTYIIVAEDRQMQRDRLHQSTDVLAEAIDVRLQATNESVSRLAQALVTNKDDANTLRGLARLLMTRRPDVLQVSYIDEAMRVRWAIASPGPLGEVAPPVGSLITQSATLVALRRSDQSGSSMYSSPYAAPIEGSPFVDLIVPVEFEGKSVGAMSARISLGVLLRETVPPETARRYRVSLLDGTEMLASTSGAPAPNDAPHYELGVPPLPDSIRLQATPYHLGSVLARNALIWVIGGLAMVLLVTLIALARHDARQTRVDRQLRAETAVRRAMEDSLATGLRVVDFEGRTLYVNRAFARMTGFSAAELIGLLPPYPYWPDGSEREHLLEVFRKMAEGTAIGGYEVNIKRKDGSFFAAQMYVSPLLADDGEQLGWMTSMSDISESKRNREQLAAAHDRFTTVLESIEAAVSVVAKTPGEEELLFANRSYLDLFGDAPGGHDLLARGLLPALPPAAPGTLTGEVQDVEGNRWFDVRVREVRWVDGRLVRLQIASDITDRKLTEDIVRQQQEKVQLTSRLITMGEMASSLAHELNQPLTAISNYSIGVITRMKAGHLPQDELFAALDKTSAQAQRAGNIIRRIREFVKRSEPRMRPTPVARVLEEAIAFAEIEARKRAVKIVTDVDPSLPPLECDPVLIEQLLLNLLKNAAEAMENASVREVKLTVRRSGDVADFAVADHGTGIPAEMKANLFQPFFSTKAEGMGMGLNICRSIVEFHNGRLTAEDNVGGGTIFRFTLPLAVEATTVQNSSTQ